MAVQSGYMELNETTFRNWIPGYIQFSAGLKLDFYCYNDSSGEKVIVLTLERQFLIISEFVAVGNFWD